MRADAIAAAVRKKKTKPDKNEMGGALSASPDQTAWLSGDARAALTLFFQKKKMTKKTSFFIKVS